MRLISAPEAEFPSWVWLWFPPVMLIAEVGTRLANERFYREIWDSELGPLENGTVLVLVPGIIAGVMALRYRATLPTAWLAGW